MTTKALKGLLHAGLLIFCLTPHFLSAQTIEADPSKIWAGNIMEVNISGTNTSFISATSTCGELNFTNVFFSQGSSTIAPLDIIPLSDELLFTVLDVPGNQTTGSYSISLWNDIPGCEVECEDCLTVMPPPELIAVDPDVSNQGVMDLSVVLTTTNNCFSQASSTCVPDISNVIFQSNAIPGTTILPESVNILDDNNVEVIINVPENATIGLYDVFLAASLPCQTSCNDCFEVIPAATIDPVGSGLGTQGESANFTVEVSNASISDCGYTATQIFLQLGDYTIEPSSVTVENQQIILEFDIPEDAPVGDYDLVVGESLGMPCEYLCEGCFTVEEMVNIRDPKFEQNFSYLPNPSSGAFQITAELPVDGAVVEIYNVAGQLIFQQTLAQLTQLDVELATTGVFVVKISARDLVAVQKVIVK